MQSILKSSHGFDLVPIESKLLTNRKIFIEGIINSETACEFLRQIMFLVSEDSEKPIDVFVNSQGGEINAGFLICDTIQSCKTPIRLFCIGQAYSMAAIIVACGKHRRYILPHSEDEIEATTIGNHFFNAEESVEFGLVDKIIGSNEIC